MPWPNHWPQARAEFDRVTRAREVNADDVFDADVWTRWYHNYQDFDELFTPTADYALPLPQFLERMRGDGDNSPWRQGITHFIGPDFTNFHGNVPIAEMNTAQTFQGLVRILRREDALDAVHDHRQRRQNMAELRSFAESEQARLDLFEQDPMATPEVGADHVVL